MGPAFTDPAPSQVIHDTPTTDDTEETQETMQTQRRNQATREEQATLTAKLKPALSSLRLLIKTALLSGFSRAAPLMNCSWIICPSLLFTEAPQLKHLIS